MDPPDDVPEFLCDEIEEVDDEIRIAVATFAERGGVAPKQIPDTIRWAFAIQDDDVIKKAGEYAQRLVELNRSDVPDEPDESEAAEEQTVEDETDSTSDNDRLYFPTG